MTRQDGADPTEQDLLQNRSGHSRQNDWTTPLAIHRDPITQANARPTRAVLGGLTHAADEKYLEKSRVSGTAADRNSEIARHQRNLSPPSYSSAAELNAQGTGFSATKTSGPIKSPNADGNDLPASAQAQYERELAAARADGRVQRFDPPTDL